MKIFFAVICTHLWRSIGFTSVIAVLALPAFGRDLDGRYAASPLHDWFEHLASGKGLCCSFADGYVVQDADWETKDGHYRVRVPRVANSEDGSGSMCRMMP